MIFACTPAFSREYRAPKPIDFSILLYDKVKLPVYKQYISAIQNYDKSKLDELSNFFTHIYINKLDKAFSTESSFILDQIKRINNLRKPVFFNVLNISLLKHITHKTTTVFFRKLKTNVANRIIGAIKTIETEFDYINGISREINIIISKKRNHDCSDYLVNELLPDDAIYKKSINLYLLQQWNQIGKSDQNIIRNSLFSFIMDPELKNYDQDIINFFFIKNNMKIDLNNIEPSRLYSETIQNYSVFLKHLWSNLKNIDSVKFNLIISNPDLFTSPEIVFKNSGLSLKNMIIETRKELIQKIIKSPEIKMDFMNRFFIFNIDQHLKKSYEKTRDYILKIPAMSFRIISTHPEIEKLEEIHVKFTDSISELYKVNKKGFLINYNHPDFQSIKIVK